MLNLNLHHIGVATYNINDELKTYLQIGYSKQSDIFIDINQGIRGVFIKSDNSPTLELLENLNEHGPLDSFLHRGIKLYHMAFSTNDIMHDMQMLIDTCSAKIVKPVMAATCFAYVGFAMLPNHTLFELVQE